MVVQTNNNNKMMMQELKLDTGWRIHGLSLDWAMASEMKNIGSVDYIQTR